MNIDLAKQHQNECVEVSLSQEALSVIESACKAESLGEEAVKILTTIAIELATFEKSRKPKMRTVKNRLTALDKVIEASALLDTAIANLDFDEILMLDGNLACSRLFPADTNPFDLELIRQVRNTINAVTQAAQNVIEDMNKRGLKASGRISTVKEYAGYILLIANNLKIFGVVPGDGGPFRRLCDAVFSAAGTHSLSQGPIKYFLSELRPSFQKLNACL